jgi:hypothetical protein
MVNWWEIAKKITAMMAAVMATEIKIFSIRL